MPEETIEATEKIIKIAGCFKMICPEGVTRWCPFLFKHYPFPIYGPIKPKQYDGKYLHCSAMVGDVKKGYLGFGGVQELFAKCPLENSTK